MQHIRGWDQFEANAALFGVKSTFNEELYTTKLDRGPQMRELEKEALRLAREIEGEDTQDLHIAEVSLLLLDSNFSVTLMFVLYKLMLLILFLIFIFL